MLYMHNIYKTYIQHIYIHTRLLAEDYSEMNPWYCASLLCIKTRGQRNLKKQYSVSIPGSDEDTSGTNGQA